MITNDFQIVVAAIDKGNGKIFYSQELNEFLYGQKSIPILNLYTGQKLFDILFDDLGIIRYEDNKLALSFLLSSNIYESAMRLLGKIAEAVIVRRCGEDHVINQKWLSKARRKNAKSTTAEKFVAVGTGIRKTKDLFPYAYNPSDTQRDIVWVNSGSKQLALMKGSSLLAGLAAGLQIKVSGNGAAYFLNALINVVYEVPVVYYDINNDYEYVAEQLWKFHQSTGRRVVTISEDFISARAVDPKSYDEVLFYKDLVMALLNGSLRPEELIANASDDTLKNAIMATGLEQINFNTNIIFSGS